MPQAALGAHQSKLARRLRLPAAAAAPNSLPMAVLLRLLTLVALLAMPFGMAAAPAEAADRHHASAPMPMEHCPEGQGSDELPTGAAKCAMPCAAAIPPADLAPVAAQAAAASPDRPQLQVPLTGILLEIATPPPKVA